MGMRWGSPERIRGGREPEPSERPPTAGTATPTARPPTPNTPRARLPQHQCVSLKQEYHQAHAQLSTPMPWPSPPHPTSHRSCTLESQHLFGMFSYTRGCRGGSDARVEERGVERMKASPAQQGVPVHERQKREKALVEGEGKRGETLMWACGLAGQLC